MVALSRFDTMSLGSMLTNFLAKLYFRGLLSCILQTVVCSIVSHSFLNSKTCNWLTFFSLSALSTVAFAVNPMSISHGAKLILGYMWHIKLCRSYMDYQLLQVLAFSQSCPLRSATMHVVQRLQRVTEVHLTETLEDMVS